MVIASDFQSDARKMGGSRPVWSLHCCAHNVSTIPDYKLIDGLATIQGGVVAILLVTSCWVSCDGLASHPGGSSNTPS